MNFIEHEFEVVKKTSVPNTIETLKADYQSLGVEPGSVIIMHSSLSKIGWTVGGPVAVIKALIEILTPKGTLIMPTFTGDNSEPSKWENPPVPREWWETIRSHMPVFQPDITPTRGMGKIVEVFRKFPNVIRSNHPISSFAAWGKYATRITKNHQLESDLGEDSPLARIYELDGRVLLLGVSHASNTSLHLAEYRSNYKSKQYNPTGCSMLVNDKQEWVVWNELNHNIDDFEDIGQSFEKKFHHKPKKVGLAESRLLSQRKMIDFAIDWIEKNRT
jgi:aminoglycoside 3-N-acetyltransferase